MELNENLREILNDLIKINNDRIEGYNRAIKESDANDVDLKTIYKRMADQSQQYVAELSREVVKLGGDPADGTTNSGKIYRAWMDVKAAFTGNDRHSILASNEYGEDVAQKAYKEALTSDEALSVEVRQLIANQQAALRESHDQIKKLRDMTDSSKNLADTTTTTVNNSL
ncbi:MAG: PA2169 family four-helix-bundle protein [Williamsia sp.]|nr:PA2169 family four-helix-bundle protein [Williamsia sp.]